MAYRPPNARAGSVGGRSLAELAGAQARSGHSRDVGAGRGRGDYSARNAGPCSVGRTQMSRSRPCESWLGRLPPGASLLGSADEFCDAFFHVRAPKPCARLFERGLKLGRATVAAAWL